MPGASMKKITAGQAPASLGRNTEEGQTPSCVSIATDLRLTEIPPSKRGSWTGDPRHRYRSTLGRPAWPDGSGHDGAATRLRCLAAQNDRPARREHASDAMRDRDPSLRHLGGRRPTELSHALL